MERIKQAQFLTSAIKQEQWPQDEIPEFCFVGRSNVGKSTFLNTICNNGKLARVSQTPGKTQMLNFLQLIIIFVVLLMFLAMVLLKGIG